MRFAVDSNILVYALIRADEVKHAIASGIMLRSMHSDAVVPAQAIGEYLNVIRRKHPEHYDMSADQAARWQTTLTILPTTGDHVIAGAAMAGKHKFQLWDAIIWQVSRSAHAAVFLSEDLQDGLRIDGMRVLNPFEPANESELNSLFLSDDYHRE